MKQVILVGAGYSIKEGIEKDLWNKIKDKTIWSCNYAFMSMPYLPTREIWVDRSFFKNNMIELIKLRDQNVEMVGKFTSSIIKLPGTKYYRGTRGQLDYIGKLGIEKDKIYCGSQGFSGTFALHLAICEGFNEIFLLGYDYGVPSNPNPTTKTHFYQDKLNVISTGIGKPIVYLDEKNKVKPAVEDYRVFLQEKDIKIWNVSIESNINCFDKITYERFFEKCQNG